MHKYERGQVWTWTSMNMHIYFSKSVFFFESGWRWACRQNGSPVRSKSPWSSQTENGAGREWHRRKRGFCTFYPILHIWPNFAPLEMEMSRSLPKWHFIWTSEGKVLGSFWQSVLCMFVEWNWVQMALSAAWKGFENYLSKKNWKLWKYNHLHLLELEWIQVQSNPSPHFIFKWNEETSRQFNKRRQFDKITPT